MKILIVGASGLVGSSLMREARKCGHDVVGTQRSQTLPGLQTLDLSDRAAGANLLAQHQPAAVICCAAWPWADGCERDPDRAFRENRDQPTDLARASHSLGASFVYFSSSYVFDGVHGPYAEEDQTNPISVYGQSKLQGETAVLEATQGTAIIARTMGVYGEEKLRKNFVYQVIDTLSAGRRMKVPDDQFGNATHSADLALMTLALLDKSASGIWNTAGPEPDLNRKDFALRIAKEYALDTSLFDFVPTSELNQPALRPTHGGLRIDKVVAAIKFVPVMRIYMLGEQRFR